MGFFFRVTFSRFLNYYYTIIFILYLLVVHYWLHFISLFLKTNRNSLFKENDQDIEGPYIICTWLLVAYNLWQLSPYISHLPPAVTFRKLFISFHYLIMNLIKIGEIKDSKFMMSLIGKFVLFFLPNPFSISYLGNVSTETKSFKKLETLTSLITSLRPCGKFLLGFCDSFSYFLWDNYSMFKKKKEKHQIKTIQNMLISSNWSYNNIVGKLGWFFENISKIHSLVLHKGFTFLTTKHLKTFTKCY